MQSLREIFHTTQDQSTAVINAIDNAISANDPTAVSVLKAIVQKLLSDEVTPQAYTRVTKSAIVHFAKTLSKLEDFDSFVEVALLSISLIKQNASNYDDADFLLREALFSKYIDAEQYSDAAQILSGVNLESTSRIFSDREKTDVLVKCAEAYLEDDATVDAEIFVNKASPFINTIDDITLQLRYKVAFARVMDANRKFLDASLRYYELSCATNANIVPEELLELLGKAVTCAVLGKAGQQRVRIMTLLHKDERLSNLYQLPKYSSHAVVLTKMLKEQLLKQDELEIFETCLLQHQKARTSDGYTIPEKAVIEHNMLAVSKLYDNIYFSELSALLGMDASRAAKIAATMIADERLTASIDQTEGILEFKHASSELERWDDNLGSICAQISNFVDIAQLSLA